MCWIRNQNCGEHWKNQSTQLYYKYSDRQNGEISVNLDQTAPKRVWSRSTVFVTLRHKTCKSNNYEYILHEGPNRSPLHYLFHQTSMIEALISKIFEHKTVLKYCLTHQLKHICFEYSKEPSHRHGSFENLQHVFWLRKNKNKFWLLHSYMYMEAC